MGEAQCGLQMLPALAQCVSLLQCEIRSAFGNNCTMRLTLHGVSSCNDYLSKKKIRLEPLVAVQRGINDCRRQMAELRSLIADRRTDCPDTTVAKARLETLMASRV